MTKCSVYVATSLDGFISRRDGEIDWLNHFNALVPEGEDLGYAQFMSGVDALVMGRNTFEQVLTFGAWPYGDKPVVVFSRQLKTLPGDMPDTVSLSADEPKKLVEGLSARGWNHLYVDGGLAIQSFLAADLIDEIIITVIPILLGDGKSLFGPLSADVELELVESRAFEFGFVQSKYRVMKST
jgi:dihydrofolate reductase